ncbi:MAG: hypothetical protein ABUK01_00435 [Leptospirales bacterium]
MSKEKQIIGRMPHFYSDEGDLMSLVSVFAHTLEEADADLLKVMRGHWVDTANNEGSKGLNTSTKGDLDKIASFYLENLGSTSLLKQVNRPPEDAGLESDAIHRGRLKGLIDILKEGASTQKGIVEIIAANLGIFGNSPEAVKSRQSIKIIEFDPTPEIIFHNQLKFSQEFSANNQNPESSRAQFVIGIDTVSATPVSLSRLQVMNLDVTGENYSINKIGDTPSGVLEYRGSLAKGDQLSIFPDGSALLNGRKVPVTGDLELAPGTSRFRIEAMVGYSRGTLDQTLYDFSLYEDEKFNELSAELKEIYSIDVEVTLMKLTPGAFRADIPWDIPGFSEKLDILEDDPRSQIIDIIQKVRAAGVRSSVSFIKTFHEFHEMKDLFKGHGRRNPLIEDHVLKEDLQIASVHKPVPGGEDIELADSLTTSGVFDYTSFDSLNRFT